jgi:negative regulator of replication initiation
MKDELILFVKQLKSDTRLRSFDEAATKQVVLLKFLSILGWDIHNIDEVVPEFVVGSQRVDYSLRNSNVNKVFIEVKKINEELDRHQEQLLNYSFKEGVKLAILTNGISWRFYLPLYEGSWDQRKFYTIEIYDQPIEDIVNRFIDYLEKTNVCSGRSIQIAESIYKNNQKDFIIQQALPKAWNKLLSEPDELLVDLIAEATEKLCGYKPDNSYVENYISSNILMGSTNSEPKKIKEPIKLQSTIIANIPSSYIGKTVSEFIFKGKRYEVKYWIDVLTQICKIMYDFHQGSFNKVLQLQGRKRPYFTRNQDELRVPQQIENSGIFMETNLSSNQIVKISLSVISLFGYSERDFTVKAR